MTARLLMIALDGMDGRRLDRWSADGALPSLAALRSRGCAKRLTAPPGITDHALWASFQYAAAAGDHGRYGRGWNLAVPDEPGLSTFWEGLASRGLRTAVLDVPKSRAPRPFNGIHLVDWLAHGRYFSEPQSYPPSLAGAVLAQFGPAPPSRCGFEQPPLSDDDIREMTGHLRVSAQRKGAAGAHYLRSEAWDLFIIGFKELHCSCHAFWDLIDVDHPAHDPARRLRLGDPAALILHEIDRTIGDLVGIVGPEAELVVFSTSDFRANGSAAPLLPKLIVALNKHLAAPAGGGRRFAGWRCLMLPCTDDMGALRVTHDRRIGRDASPDPAEHTKVVDELQSLLADLTDADTGTRVVESFVRPSAQWPGVRAAELPDLLILYQANLFPAAVASPCLGRIGGAARIQPRPGNHRAGGFLIAAGAASRAAADAVNSMADFGPFAERVLCGPVGAGQWA
jgi:predicted AlkP superfamily phosphohydrolase/phosphomutase